MGSNRQRRVSMEASSLSCIVTRASFVMAGEQSVNIGSHHARTEQARLLLTWPTVMVTFTSVEQVEVVVEAFTDATGAARRLPERAAPSMLTGLAEFSTFVPAVSIVLVDTPTTVVRSGPVRPSLVPGDGRTVLGGSISRLLGACGGCWIRKPTPASWSPSLRCCRWRGRRLGSDGGVGERLGGG